MISQPHTVERAGWLFTPGELRIDGLEMEEAITVARGLVDLATAGRFWPDTVPAPVKQRVSETPFPATRASSAASTRDAANASAAKAEEGARAAFLVCDRR
jgi:hypothetical protein